MENAEIRTEKQQEEKLLILLPEGAKAIAEIPLEFIEGTFKDRVARILNGDRGLMEVSDREYEVLRELLTDVEIPFKILVGIPNVNSPRSFLSEMVQSRVMSYHNLKFSPSKEEDKFIDELKTLEEENSTIEEDEDE